MSAFNRRGWERFPADDRSRRWVAAARAAADRVVADPANAHWLRCGKTWFAGVNLLENGVNGAIGDAPLAGPAINALAAMGQSPDAWDAAQISVVYPGYPRPHEGETEAASRFRRHRDGAHVDGLLPIGPDRRRMLREAHGFVLGLPLSRFGATASPMVVWEGSHEIMRAAFARVLANRPVAAWPQTDLTEIYHAARRACFDQCPRIEVHANPGEAYLVHRLALHGVAPWAKDATTEAAGRMIAYFRPEMPMQRWLDAP